jgi:hypothetical protein
MAESVSNAVRIVVEEGRRKVILARLAPKQIPECETQSNAELMSIAPILAQALISIVESGLVSGYDHPLDYCRCGNCVLRRLAAQCKVYLGKEQK